MPRKYLICLPSARRLSSLLVVLALASTPTHADADGWERGLETGDGHLVTVSANPAAGLEAGMPRDGAYARGIEFDRQMRWADSYTAYTLAITEFGALTRKRPRWAKMIAGWIQQAQYMRSQSSQLRPPTSYYRSRYYRRYYYQSTSYRYRRAEAMHNKWLAVRAFTGRAPRPLLLKIIEGYKYVISKSSSYTQAKINLAAIYHETGRHAEGRRLFSKIPPREYTHTWKALWVAYYYSAAGDATTALRYLKKATSYSSSNTRRVMRQSNDFDRLRSHPEFRKLLGEQP